MSPWCKIYFYFCLAGAFIQNDLLKRSKNSLRSSNPVSDRAPVLRKPILNDLWLNLILLTKWAYWIVDKSDLSLKYLHKITFKLHIQ